MKPVLIGQITAAVFSALLNHSFWWALLHLCCGWIYVIYVLCHRFAELKAALR